MKLFELLHSDSAVRFPDIYKQQTDLTIIPKEVLVNLNALNLKLIEPLQAALAPSKVVCPSGYRCTALNKLVGGSSKSQHVLGLAADLQLIKMVDLDGSKDDFRYNASFEIFNWYLANLNSLPIHQLIHEFGAFGRPAWVHVGLSLEDNPRREVLIATKTPKGTTAYEVYES